MIHINPVSEDQASPQTKAVYSDLKLQLKLNSVLYYFQLVAAFEDFSQFFWFHLRPTLADPQFQSLIQKQISSSKSSFAATLANHQLPPELTSLIPQFSQKERDELLEKFQSLQNLYGALLFISILVRESLKGLVLSPENPTIEGKSSQFPSESKSFTISRPTSEITTKELHLSPTIESQGPLSNKFLSLIFEFMENFVQTADFVQIRLQLENQTQIHLKSLTQKFVLPPGQAKELLYNRPFAAELVFLLYDFFPGHFPRQFLTANILEIFLNIPTSAKVDPPFVPNFPSSETLKIP